MRFNKTTIPLISILFVLGQQVSAGVYQDSLARIIQFSKNDSVKMISEAELARSVISIDWDSAINSMNRALVHAKNLNYVHNQGIYLKSIGIFYYSISSYSFALDYLKEAEKILIIANDTNEIADALFFSGICFNEMGNHELSIDYFYQSLKLYELLHDTVGVGRTLNNLGVNLEAMGEDESAYKLYDKAFKLKKKSNDYSGMANAYINLGNTKLKMGQSDSGLYFHKLALQASNLLRDNRLTIDALSCLGNDYLSKDDYSEAIKVYEQALEKFNKYRNDYQLSGVYNGLAKAHLLKGDSKKALTYVQYNINNLKKIGASNLLKNSYLVLAEVRNSIGDYNEAYEAMKEYSLIKDSIYNSEKLSAIAEMQEKYQANRRQSEINDLTHKNALNKLENEKQDNLIVGFVIFSIFITIFLIFVIVMYKQRNNANQLLTQSLKEKEVLIKEVHHRVKNNFQLISSLLNLQSDLITDKKALVAITEGRNRIASMALVHQNLYLTENLTSIEMQNYIVQLLESIIASSESDNVQVNYKFEAENISFDVDTSVPLGLVINELLTNSIKYAFVGRKVGNVSLKMRQIEGDKYELLFSDDGVGIPESVDMDNLSSLGLELVQLLVAQLNGSVKHTVNNGTHFKIIFNKA